jgi:hypothetical protein
MTPATLPLIDEPATISCVSPTGVITYLVPSILSKIIDPLPLPKAVEFRSTLISYLFY